MSGIIKGELYKGWQIWNPTLGSNFLYTVTRYDKPEFKMRFKHIGEAKRWIDNQPK